MAHTTVNVHFLGEGLANACMYPCSRCRYADTWLAWVAMERSLRQVPAARAVLKRCLNRNLEADGQLALAMQWLRFEREEGRWGGDAVHGGRAVGAFTPALCLLRS